MYRASRAGQSCWVLGIWEEHDTEEYHFQLETENIATLQGFHVVAHAVKSFNIKPERSGEEQSVGSRLVRGAVSQKENRREPST